MPAVRPAMPCCAPPACRRSWTWAPSPTCAAIKGRVPFLHFFDGFRTSHEIQKIEVWDYEDLKDMVDLDAVERVPQPRPEPRITPCSAAPPRTPTSSSRPAKPATPTTRRFPTIVEEYMDKVNEKIGTNYQAVQLLRRAAMPSTSSSPWAPSARPSRRPSTT